jgi:hypothetical protein
MGLEATIGQLTREAGDLGRFAAANSSRASGLKEAVRFTASRRSQVAMFQQKTPEVSALVTVFLDGEEVRWLRWERFLRGGREMLGVIFLCMLGRKGLTCVRRGGLDSLRTSHTAGRR